MKLNLCSGPNIWPGPGWIHIDRVDQREYLRILREDVSPEMAATWPADQRWLSEYLRAGGKIRFFQADALDLMNFCGVTADESLDMDDGSFEAIYLGQCIEHFNRRTDALELLRECHALLKPGGVLRITTPDLDLLLDAYRSGQMYKFAPEQPAFYADAAPADQLAYLMYGATGPECDWQNYEGHFHCYTRGTIATLLTEAGFSGPYEFGAKSEVFADAVDKGMSHSLAVEAVK